MNDESSRLAQSVVIDASRAFAWSYMTAVTNWDDPPARFALDGPFAAGAQGTTLMPDQSPVQWRISAVEAGRSYTIETALAGATLSFVWSFEALSDRRTRLTQQIVLTGENAPAYVGQVASGFGANLESGMTKLATTIATAAGRCRDAAAL